MTEAQRLMDQLVGAWTLVEWSERRPDGGKAFPLGADAIGQIIYSADGHVAAQLARRDVRSFASGDWRDARVDEASRAFKDYFGYFGPSRSTVPPAPWCITSRAHGFRTSMASIRRVGFSIDGDVLHLDADTDWGQVVIIWKRAGRSPAMRWPRESAA